MPFQYSTSKTVESKICPGVVFTLRKMTERRRAERELSLVPLREKLKELNDQYAAAREDDSRLQELIRLSHEMTIFVQENWYSAWIRWAISKVDGLVIDDEPADLDRMLEEAPDELLTEAYHIAESGGLNEEEQKNSQQPSGSAEQAAGSTQTSTAEPADTAASTESATAESSQSTSSS